VPEVSPVAVPLTAMTVTVPPVTVTATVTPVPLSAATVLDGTAGVVTGVSASPPVISDHVPGQETVTLAVSTNRLSAMRPPPRFA